MSLIHLRTVVLAVAVGALTSTSSASAQQTVVVNGTTVEQTDFAREFARLGIQLGIEIPAGNYWYDPMAGLWGVVGGPAMGQMPPEMSLGGALAPDVSVGGTGVFINGRELHMTEAAYLQQLFGYVIPGRYWLNAMGIGGFEGGPASFNLAAAAQQAGGSYSRRGPFGSMGSDGQCSYFMTPGGSSVMTGNC